VVPSWLAKDEQWLAVLDRLTIVDEHVLDDTGPLALDAAQHPHCFNGTYYLTHRHGLPRLNRLLRSTPSRPMEDTDQRRGNDVRLGEPNGVWRLDLDPRGAAVSRKIALDDEACILVLDLKLLNVGVSDEAQQLAKLVRE
jgi:hypothetical protein